MSPSSIEFWFEFASTYSYLSIMRIEPEAARLGVEVKWRPFLLGPIFKSFGWSNSPFVLQPWKTEYVWKDMERQCHKYGLPWKHPSVFPRATILPARVALAGTGKPWMPEFCRRIMQLNFGSDQDISSPACVSEVLTQLGLRSTEILEEAEDEANKLRLRAQTDAAKAKGVFGAPTFFVGDEMFWGNDRLDDAFGFAAASKIPPVGILSVPS